MKNYLLSLLSILLTLAVTQTVKSSGTSSNDPWLDQYRAKKTTYTLVNPESSEEFVKFFDELSFGGSAGVGLFHGSLADYDIFAPLDEFSTYYKFAWRIHAAREIKWGLTAKLQFEKGTLGGGRLPGKQSIPVDFESKYNTISLVASYDILELLSKKKGLKNHKIFLNAEIGIGLSLFRSLSYWRAEDGRIRDHVGYEMTESNPPTQRYTAAKKTNPAVAFNVPVGFMFGYRVNHKTDVTFSYTLNNLSTKRLDAWSREFNSNDKYSYFGLGLRYTFNRDKSSYPRKKEKEKKEKKSDDEKWKLFGSKKEDVQPNAVQLETPISSRQSGKITPGQQTKDLEDVKLKMFELQLKLFEMQYLLNGGEPAKQGK